MSGRVQTIDVSLAARRYLRGFELITSGIVLGIVAYFLKPFADERVVPMSRFIFAVIWAAFSVLISGAWLWKHKFTRKFTYTLDLALSVGWMIITGLIIHAFKDQCPFFRLSNVDQFCGLWKTVQVLSIVSFILWLGTGLLQVRFTMGKGRGGRGGGRGGGGGGGGGGYV